MQTMSTHPRSVKRRTLRLLRALAMAVGAVACGGHAAPEPVEDRGPSDAGVGATVASLDLPAASDACSSCDLRFWLDLGAPLGECDPNAPIGGGDGSAEVPYRICAAHQLDFVRSNSSAHFRLLQDLELGGAVHEPIPPLDGVFDGHGYAIRDVVIDTPDADDVGLFHTVAQGGVIRDLALTGFTIHGRNNVGALAGTLRGTVHDVTLSDASVTGHRRVGGLIGQALSNAHLEPPEATSSPHLSLTNIQVQGVFSGTARSQDVGGLVGLSSGAVMSHIDLVGAVEGNCNLGGVVGRAIGSTITVVSADAAVTSLETTPRVFCGVGGLVGQLEGLSALKHGTATGEVRMEGAGHAIGGAVGLGNQGYLIENVHAWGRVASEHVSHPDDGQYVGGLIGTAGSSNAPRLGEILRSSAHGDVYFETFSGGGFVGSTWSNVRIAECVATGDVSRQFRAAGFVGQMRNSNAVIENSYAVGTVTGTHGTASWQRGFAGGFVGLVEHLTHEIRTSFSASPSVSYLQGGEPVTASFVGRSDVGADVFSNNRYVKTDAVALDTYPEDNVALYVAQAPLASDPASYDDFDFESVWTFPLVNPLNPHPVPIPVLRWQCGRDGIVCPE